MDSRRVVLGISAIVFAASAAMTIAGCLSMSAMGAMEMPGDWAMSHMWMRMPGQALLGAAASFVGMWVVMMVTMMLPSLTRALLCCRESVARAGVAGLGVLTALVGMGYFAVWAAFGAIVYLLGVVLADIMMREPTLSRAVPAAGGAAVLIAGVLQHTAWKARHLAFCREAPGRHITLSPDAGAACRHGVRLGLRCVQSCAGLTAVVLTLGVMDLRVMAAATAAITAERLALDGARVARATGTVVVGAGLFLIARASWL